MSQVLQLNADYTAMRVVGWEHAIELLLDARAMLVDSLHGKYVRSEKLVLPWPSVIALKRIYVSGAVECDVDKLGRVLIPGTLRKHAELTRDVLWAGMGPNIELWDKDAHENLRRDVLGDPDKRQAMARRLADLGL